MENKVRVGVITADVNKVQQQVSRFIPQTFSHKEELPVEIYETEPLSPMINAYGGLSLYSTTVEIGGRYNGKRAILTCGHGHSVGDILPSDTGETLFKFVKCRFKNQQYYDYGIAEVVSDSVDVLPLVRNESGEQFIKSINQSPAIGMTVAKYGQTTQYTTGIVTGLDVGVSIGNTVIYGFVDTGLKALDDDSGGPVYAGDNMYGTVSAGTYTLYTQRMLFSPSAAISNFVLGS